MSATRNDLLRFGTFELLVFAFGGILSFQLTRLISKTSKRLNDNNDRYNKAEQIGEFGHYEWSLTNSQFESSSEFNRIFGLDPDDDILTFEQVADLIHDDDKNSLLDLVESVVAQKNKNSIELPHLPARRYPIRHIPYL